MHGAFYVCTMHLTHTTCILHVNMHCAFYTCIMHFACALKFYTCTVHCTHARCILHIHTAYCTSVSGICTTHVHCFVYCALCTMHYAPWWFGHVLVRPPVVAVPPHAPGLCSRSAPAACASGAVRSPAAHQVACGAGHSCVTFRLLSSGPGRATEIAPNWTR